MTFDAPPAISAGEPRLHSDSAAAASRLQPIRPEYSSTAPCDRVSFTRWLDDLRVGSSLTSARE